MAPRPPAPSRYRFPDANTGIGPNGIVCLGGDFAPGTLLSSYRQGIFPWPISPDMVPWCSPDPRALFLLDAEPEWSKSVRRALKKPFRVSFDRAFSSVLTACGERSEGTWITTELSAGFRELHALGWAHSVEVWNEAGALVGGLYGLGVGAMFAGESMFHRETDASKVAFARLVEALHRAGYAFFDAQLMTPHLASLGCGPVPRVEFLARLSRAVRQEREFPAQ